MDRVPTADTVSQNPYSVTGAPDALDGSPKGRPVAALITWIVLYWLNTPLCLMLGWNSTNVPGRFGMMGGCLLLLWAGIVLIRRAPGLRATMICGAALMALSQFSATPQLYAGMLAHTICEAIWLVDPISIGGKDPYRTIQAGLAMTLLTGGFLIAGSLVAGMIPAVIWNTPGARSIGGREALRRRRKLSGEINTH